MMPTPSEESDLRLDRIEAREAHYHQSIQTRPRSPTAKKRVDSTELGSIGAHLNVASEVESYPERIDDLTNETPYQDDDSAPKLQEDIFRVQPDSKSNVLNEEAAIPPCTGKCDTSLTPSEFKEFQRQRSTNKRRPPSSISTNLDKMNDEQSPTGRRGIPVPSVVNPTPSHRSIGTYEGNRTGENGSVLPGSDYNSKIGKTNGREEK